jgi:hypothetical protein
VWVLRYSTLTETLKVQNHPRVVKSVSVGRSPPSEAFSHVHASAKACQHLLSSQMSKFSRCNNLICCFRPLTTYRKESIVNTTYQQDEHHKSRVNQQA